MLSEEIAVLPLGWPRRVPILLSVASAFNGLAKGSCSLESRFSSQTDVLVGWNRPRVLVVEDDPVSAMLVRKLLKGHNIESDHAINGKQAIDMHQERHYKLIVSDWMMPEMSGIDLCRFLRTSDEDYLYFVLCSAKGERADRLEAFEAGVDDFLSKPLDKEELASRLLVARRILGSEEILRQKTVELQKIQVALQETNANLAIASRRFEELFNGLPVACFTFDEAGIVHEWNRSAEIAFGIEPHLAFMRPVWEVLGKDSAPSSIWSKDEVRRIITSEGIPEMDWTYPAKDGDRHLVCNVFVLKNTNGDLMGAISANLDITERKKAEQRIEEQMRQINDFATQLESQKVALEEANALLALRADTDGLTGLLNHRRMQGDLEDAFHRARRFSKPLSVILMDVDHFKSFNDTFGHQAGDDVLKLFSQILRGTSREHESVARYGGEEFAVILEGCPTRAGIAAAERFRQAILSATWPHRDMTASFGVATLNSEIKTARELLLHADKALYASKESGRNRVTHWDDLDAPIEMDSHDVRSRLLRDLQKEAIPHEKVTAFVEGLPISYLLGATPETARMHLLYAEKAAAGEPSVECFARADVGATAITVCAVDRLGLLREILGVLYALDISLLSLSANTTLTQPPIALDQFTVAVDGRAISSGKQEILQKKLLAVLNGEQTAEEVLLERNKDPRKDQHILLHSFTEGDPGMLEITAARGRGMPYRLALFLSEQGWHIVSARIGKWAGSGTAAFHITGPEGHRLRKAEVDRAFGADPMSKSA
jgi:two-component system cell cycle response regulator